MVLLAIVFATMATVNVNAQWSNNATSIWTTDLAKNVGIGTVNPTSKLSIQGGSISINNNSSSINKWGYPGIGYVWDVALKTGKSNAWRMEDAVTGLGNYIGFGIARNPGGWFWISSSRNDSSAIVKYPMQLLCVDVNSANLQVQGRVKCSEVLVAAKWWDDVFKSEYNLRPLEEVKAFIAANKHLPDVTPGPVIETEGLEVGKASSQMIRKIEELTLYMIQLNDKMKEKDVQIVELQKQIELLKNN